jgi:hypothetical protein
MSQRLHKTTECVTFGNQALVDFFEQHGAHLEAKVQMGVPVGAVRAALEHATELGLSPSDIAFLQRELEECEVVDDEDFVDYYDVG